MNRLTPLEEWLLNYGPLSIFFLDMCAAFVVVLLYNIRTHRIVKEIQKSSNSEGYAWPFWSSWKRGLDFVMNPERLIDVEDSPNVRAAKQVLVEHSRRVTRYLVYATIIALVSFLAAISIPIIIALTD